MTTNRCYVYAIHVNGVVRYIGKGSNGRLHFHVIEARRINSRRALGAKTDRTTTNFYRKLAEAMRHGATITEEIMVDGLPTRRLIGLRNRRSSNSISRIVVNCGMIDERFVGITWAEFKRKRSENIEAIQRKLLGEGRPC